MTTRTVLVAGSRTPIGKLGGKLASLSAEQLGAHAIQHALSRAGVAASTVDMVIMGNVVQAGVGPNPARQAAVGAQIPLTTPAVTLNNLCLSGLQAVIDGDRLIKSGEADIVVAGGMESMTNAPHLVRGARTGLRYGGSRLEDALDADALRCAFDQVSMGESTDRYARAEVIGRADQDDFAARSHRRAAEATDDGTFTDEIAPIDVHTRRGPVTITNDEGIRANATPDALSALPPAFAEDGTITAGSSSQLSDGAAALVLMSEAKATELGLQWLAEIGPSAFVAGPDTSLLHQPSRAIIAAVNKMPGMKVSDVSVIEINEAFAAVALASMADLGLSAERVNVHGGAIALGHPVGMSGARLVLSLALSMVRRGDSVGAAALCGGGGQGNAVVLRR
ncbi:acetyl-CoA C-acyltransferase [Rhodococcus cercidiphylli]|uniref:Probable acetyl-CoA acetyltransferase n=1 Tax=Rhodococcus cercidiphylli TaxID=489916 RepID=A0ABU4AWL2_9NOCA|nr:acetyl-CoA C-acyltransferase [Rhodococcus cercidiphylli]MDV6230628.1 acetyl-CoA C-acyltransferase [Rhodococcus cercidiphylli]